MIYLDCSVIIGPTQNLPHMKIAPHGVGLLEIGAPHMEFTKFGTSPARD